MSEKMKLFRMIQKYDFSLYEFQLYLDTHPNCTHALRMWNNLQNMRKKAVSSYVQQFGPIRPDQTDSSAPWSWVQGPWPWEKEAN